MRKQEHYKRVSTLLSSKQVLRSTKIRKFDFFSTGTDFAQSQSSKTKQEIQTDHAEPSPHQLGRKQTVQVTQGFGQQCQSRVTESEQVSTRDLTPMERWKQECAHLEPWNGIQSFNVTGKGGYKCECLERGEETLVWKWNAEAIDGSKSKGQ